MAEAQTPEAQPATAPQISNKIIAQYVRDMSFENILVQKGVNGAVEPEIAIKVNLDARKRGADNQYEVLTKVNITSTNKADKAPLFVLEVEYAGVFQVEGVPEEQLHPFLLIECPRMTFPFLRRVVSDVTRDGGFPPLNLETIDFVGIYRNELNRRIEEQKTKTN